MLPLWINSKNEYQHQLLNKLDLHKEASSSYSVQSVSANMSISSDATDFLERWSNVLLPLYTEALFIYIKIKVLEGFWEELFYDKKKIHLVFFDIFLQDFTWKLKCLLRGPSGVMCCIFQGICENCSSSSVHIRYIKISPGVVRGTQTLR